MTKKRRKLTPSAGQCFAGWTYRFSPLIMVLSAFFVVEVGAKLGAYVTYKCVFASLCCHFAVV